MPLSFGEQLRLERKKQGLTTEKLAKSCGVSRSYITLIENGRRSPGKKILPKLAAALEVKTAIVLNWYLEEVSQKIREALDVA